jgi:hypothetical protein
MESMTEMELQLKRNMLRYHVGHEILCPACGAIMDCTRAVEIDRYHDGELASTKVLCARCFDAARNTFDFAASHAEVTDGRELFAKPAKVDAPVERRPLHKADIRIGGTYLTNQGLRVTVLRAKGSYTYGGRYREMTHWICRSHKTGREITIKSAARFVREVHP